jgi:hypothetical protein
MIEIVKEDNFPGHFINRYGKYKGYGFGCMLVYIDETRKLQYVHFTGEANDTGKKEVVDKHLVKLYKGDITYQDYKELITNE